MSLLRNRKYSLTECVHSVCVELKLVSLGVFSLICSFIQEVIHSSLFYIVSVRHCSLKTLLTVELSEQPCEVGIALFIDERAQRG